MSILKSLFGWLSGKKDQPADSLPIQESPEISVEQFKVLTAENRLRHLLFINNGEKEAHFAVMQQAILHDSDKNVRMAALKRIHFFKNKPETVLMLNKLKAEQDVTYLEPYFSMASLNIGLINEEQFNSIFK